MKYWIKDMDGRRELENQRFAAIFALADMQARNAVGRIVPTPMIVVNGPHEEPVADGVCGFAWITIRPLNSLVGRWAKANLPDWEVCSSGGLRYWVGHYSKSMQRKEVYAQEFARVLREHGIEAYAHSMMD